MAATLTKLRQDYAKAWDEAHEAGKAAKRIGHRLLLIELRAYLDKHPETDSLMIEADYSYDDQGGYYRSLSGYDEAGDEWGDFVFDAAPPLADVEQEVWLELFGIDDTGEGALTRAQVLEAAEKAGV